VKQATLYDLLQADTTSTYKQWTETLSLLRQITDPAARRMMEAELSDLYAKAVELRETNQLQPMQLSMVNIILSRTLEQWTVLNRHPHSTIISTY
jgi:hypothetical protein